MRQSKELPEKLLEPDYMLMEHLEVATNFSGEASYFQRESSHAYYRNFHLKNHHYSTQTAPTTKKEEEDFL